MFKKPKLFLLDLHSQTDCAPFDTLDLAQRLLEQGIEVALFDDLSVFAEQLKQDQSQMAASAAQSTSTRPGYVVAWVDKGEQTDTQHKTQLAALQNLMADLQQPMPWVVLSTQEDMSKQIAALQAGASHYWVQPKDARELVEKLAQLTGLIEHQPYRVVMVDDSEIVLEVQTALLRHAGIEVWPTENPLELPELLKLVKPDVLVLDLHMPQACGSQVAWAVRQSQSEAELPIIFVSGEDDLAHQLLALKQGGDDFLVKPIKPKQFIETVKMRAQRARQHNRLQDQLKHKLYEQSREHQALNQHAIVSVADRAGNIVLVNDKFCEISGYAREDLIGKNHRLVKSNRHLPRFYQELWRTIASGEVWQGEICNLSKQGQEYWVKSTITPFLNEAGQVYQYVSIRTDISQIKKLEFEQQQRLNELEQARQEAERANRAKSDFLASMSHELRTPLNSIIGFSQLLELSDLSDKQKKQLHTIGASGKHLLSLINDVLEFAKLESGKLALNIETVDVRPIIEQVIALSESHAYANNIKINLSPDTHKWQIKADPLRFKQVLLNLTSNGIKYNRPNGKLDINWHKLEQDNQAWWELQVKDTGLGIAEQDLPGLFEPFNRLGHEGSTIEGTGIGLSITQDLVEQMGGQITVESEVNVGTTFKVRFPLDQQATNSASSDSAASTQAELDAGAQNVTSAARSLKVLYVEDNPANMKLMAEIAQLMEGIELRIAPSAENGLQQAQAWLPSVILLDINLPGMNGDEAIAHFRAIPGYSRQPTIYAVTANVLEEQVAHYNDCGFDEVIAKPFDIAQIMQRLEAVRNNQT